jgi:hypothetical protein
MFAGRVGTGFSEKLLASIEGQLQKIRRATCPFINLPERTRGRWGLGITPAVMNRCRWVKPVLIVQVKFAEWTHDDQLRQPIFLGLRTDKEAKGVVRAYLEILRCHQTRCGRSNPLRTLTKNCSKAHLQSTYDPFGDLNHPAMFWSDKASSLAAHSTPR